MGPDAPIVPHRQALESAAPAPRPPHSARIPASSNAPDRVPRGAVRQLSLSLWGPPSPVDGVQPIPANHLQAAPQRPAPQRLSFALSTRCRISCTHRRAFQPDLRWPVHCPEEGLRKKQRHLSRHLLIVGLLLLVGATTVAAQSVKFYATGDIPVANGGMLNDYTYTQASDDQYEDITEAKKTTGPPYTTYTYLEHKWTIPVDGTYDSWAFYLQAHHTPSYDGDHFAFAWSPDDVAYALWSGLGYGRRLLEQRSM